MQRERLTETTSIVGIILIALGIVSLTYFLSPLRLIMQAVRYEANPVAPILGGLALVSGIALLYATRPRG
jgi:formate-dependent nitrite reductase membrane component NrfD